MLISSSIFLFWHSKKVAIKCVIKRNIRTWSSVSSCSCMSSDKLCSCVTQPGEKQKYSGIKVCESYTINFTTDFKLIFF